jgi:hypothetical protein
MNACSAGPAKSISRDFGSASGDGADPVGGRIELNDLKQPSR